MYVGLTDLSLVVAEFYYFYCVQVHMEQYSRPKTEKLKKLLL